MEPNYYNFTSQKDYYIEICNLEDEIELINFNTADTFFFTKYRTIETSYESKAFKIIYDSSLYSGKFNIYNRNNNKYKTSQSDNMTNIKESQPKMH